MNEYSEGDDLDLWSYMVALYDHGPLSRACLEAQDAHGLDVNLLLAAAWCARRGLVLDVAAVGHLDELCRDWREKLIEPLRQIRRQWKDELGPEADYSALKALELQAERQQVLRLESELAPQIACSEGTVDIQANVDVVCRHFRIPPTLSANLATAIAAGAQSAARNPPD